MKKKIVLIDDKISIAKVVSIYLSSEYELIYFENPIKAIEWLQKGDMPDLIISDIRMPEMRGDEFLSYMKKTNFLNPYPLLCFQVRKVQQKGLGYLRKALLTISSNHLTPWSLKYV